MQRSKQKQSATLRALGEAVRTRRINHGFSQEELGAAASVHRTYITDIENGLRNLSFLMLLRLAKGLDCAISELVAEAELIDGFDR